MSYSDKGFYFDFNNRMVKLEDSSGYDFKSYGQLSVRKRWIGEDYEAVVSIELWGRTKGDKREEDAEVMLTRDNALLLASKLQRAVAELDADLYRKMDREDLSILINIAGDAYDEERDRLRECSLLHKPKGGIAGALSNYLQTPAGQDVAKKLEKE